MKFLLHQGLKMLLELLERTLFIRMCGPWLLGAPCRCLMVRTSTTASISPPQSSQKVNLIKPHSDGYCISYCDCIFRGVCGYLVHAFPCTWKCTCVLCAFFCDYVCKPCSPPSLFLWFSGKFPDCRCAGLENIEAVTKAPAVSVIIPCASPCTASPSKERWLLGTLLGTWLGDGKWARQRRSRHASRKQDCNQWCSTE